MHGVVYPGVEAIKLDGDYHNLSEISLTCVVQFRLSDGHKIPNTDMKNVLPSYSTLRYFDVQLQSFRHDQTLSKVKLYLRKIKTLTMVDDETDHIMVNS